MEQRLKEIQLFCGGAVFLALLGIAATAVITAGDDGGHSTLVTIVRVAAVAMLLAAAAALLMSVSLQGDGPTP